VSEFVLDASALLALLNNEPGAQRVRDILPKSIISAVNLCEVVGKLTAAGLSVEDARTSVGLLDLEVAPFDSESAYKAGALIVQTRRFGLSLGDRACLGLGLTMKKTVVTAERLWPKLKLGVKVETIREGASTLKEPEDEGAS
jgi:ribonuclease VapC